jgi:hypothetical protein
MHLWKYKVIGRICPHGLTAENCRLRIVLERWQQRYGNADLTKGFGYKVLDNGVLLVPFEYWEKGVHVKFCLDALIKETCDGDCWKKDYMARRNNPDEFEACDGMQTVIFAGVEYDRMNCPANMTPEKCKLCKKLADQEEKYNIGYKKLGENILLMPVEHYDPKNNVYIDMAKQESDMCHKCMIENCQKTK